MMYQVNNNGNRFVVPFLVGALAGGAAVGVTRPRPIVSVPVQNGPYPIPYPQPYPMPYNNGFYSSYGYQYYRPY